MSKVYLLLWLVEQSFDCLDVSKYFKIMYALPKCEETHGALFLLGSGGLDAFSHYIGFILKV